MLAQPRALQQKLPAVAKPKFRAPAPALEAVAAAGPPSGNVLGVAQIAADIDWHTAERTGVPPLIVSQFEGKLERAQQVNDLSALESVSASAQTEARLNVLQYIAAVQARDAKLQAAEARAPKALKKATSKPRSKSPTAKRTAKRPKARRKTK